MEAHKLDKQIRFAHKHMFVNLKGQCQGATTFAKLCTQMRHSVHKHTVMHKQC